jgi:FkbM family methyltransferase
VKRMMRRILIPPLRAYFRYTSSCFGKTALWNNFVAHLWWLESHVTAKTVFGNTVHVDAGDISGRYIYYFGVWEPNLTEWIRQRLRAGDTFIDVGANIGYYSLLASALVGTSGSVVAIEALPQIFGILKRNLQVNSASNVRAVNVAAWDRNDVVQVFTQPDNPPGTTTLIPAWAEKWNLSARCEVPAAPLSTVLSWDEMQAARLIKIDVEGAEWHVLSGMSSMICAARKDLEIIVEVAPRMLEAEGITCQDLLHLFSTWGFNSYRIDNDYSAASYITRGVPVRPKRIETIPTSIDQTDLVFSRINAGSL